MRGRSDVPVNENWTDSPSAVAAFTPPFQTLGSSGRLIEFQKRVGVDE